MQLSLRISSPVDNDYDDELNVEDESDQICGPRESLLLDRRRPYSRSDLFCTHSRDPSGSVSISKEQLMAEHIYRKAQALDWFPDAEFGIVAVRISVGHYVTYPLMDEVEGSEILMDDLCRLNCAAAILSGTHVVERIIRQLSVAPPQRPRVILSLTSICSSPSQVAGRALCLDVGRPPRAGH